MTYPPLRVCDGCSTPNKGDDWGTWWNFKDYRGPKLQAAPGSTLTGYYCPACSSKIYEEPGGFERAVVVAQVTARLKA